jgi:hypothetical protein
MHKQLWLTVVAVACLGGAAHASDGDSNWLIGPVFGVWIGGSTTGGRGLIGIEGGYGFGPERVNLGLERRAGKTLGYLELDPWYGVGISLGYGIDSDGAPHGIVGLWEGVPLINAPKAQCGEQGGTLTFAFGYRYTGVHELYVTVKGGTAGKFCI